MFRLNRRAQSTAEYAIVIALVIGAVVAMQVYVRRGLQARMKGATDYLISETSGEGEIPKQTTTGLYEPKELEREITQSRTSPTYEIVSKDAGFEGEVQRGIRDTEEEVTTVDATSYEKYKAPE